MLVVFYPDEGLLWCSFYVLALN